MSELKNRFMETPILGVITAVSVASVDRLQPNGSSEKADIVKFKLESASIEDPQMMDFYPEAITMIRSVSPCPAEEMKFSKIFTNLLLKVTPESEDNDFLPGVGIESETSMFGRCEISKMSAKVKSDIPVYIFEMSFPVGYGNIPDMVGFYREKIKFELSRYEVKDGEEDPLASFKKLEEEHNCKITLTTGKGKKKTE